MDGGMAGSWKERQERKRGIVGSGYEKWRERRREQREWRSRGQELGRRGGEKGETVRNACR